MPNIESVSGPKKAHQHLNGFLRRYARLHKLKVDVLLRDVERWENKLRKFSHLKSDDEIDAEIQSDLLLGESTVPATLHETEMLGCSRIVETRSLQVPAFAYVPEFWRQVLPSCTPQLAAGRRSEQLAADRRRARASKILRVCYLFFRENLEAKTVAAALGISQAAVYSAVKRIVRRGKEFERSRGIVNEFADHRFARWQFDARMQRASRTSDWRKQKFTENTRWRPRVEYWAGAQCSEGSRLVEGVFREWASAQALENLEIGRNMDIEFLRKLTTERTVPEPAGGWGLPRRKPEAVRFTYSQDPLHCNHDQYGPQWHWRACVRELVCGDCGLLLARQPVNPVSGFPAMVLPENAKTLTEASALRTGEGWARLDAFFRFVLKPARRYINGQLVTETVDPAKLVRF